MVSHAVLADHPSPVGPYSSTSGSVGSAVGLENYQKICQLHIEQWLLFLPIVAVWITHFCSETRQRATYTYGCAPLDLSFSEFTPVNFLSLLKREEHCYAANLPSAQHPVYVYSLPDSSESDQSASERGESSYLVVWVKEPLPDTQQKWLKSQIYLLTQQFQLQRHLVQQQAEIGLLEQAIQRTEHQLRNSLNLLHLYADLLHLGLSDQRLQSYVEQIQETVHEVRTSLNSLMYCGKPTQLQPSIWDLREILQEVIQEMRPWLQEKHLQVNYPAQPLPIQVDRVQIKIVLSNLLDNAIHFSPPDSMITWNWQSFYSEAFIEISDQGPGLAPTDLQQAFSPYYSQRSNGTGLGLAIAKKIVLDHQGSIWVDNLCPNGAHFSIVLPRFGQADLSSSG